MPPALKDLRRGEDFGSFCTHLLQDLLEPASPMRVVPAKLVLHGCSVESDTALLLDHPGRVTEQGQITVQFGLKHWQNTHWFL